MKHNVLWYLLGEGFRNVFNNKKSSGASLAIMCATMLIFGVFFLIVENINNMVNTLEEKQGMQVFIKEDATDADMEKLGEQIKALDGVNTVTFVSKAEALDSVKQKLKDKQKILIGWDEENPFRASYVVTLTDLKLSSSIQDEISKFDNIYSIESKDETINALVSIANGVRIVSATILILLILISVFIIANTIKLTVHARRKEISIMKYVGATDGFIRWPFIIEGILIGMMAALISVGLLAIVYTLLSNSMQNSTVIQRMGVNLLAFNQMINLLAIVYVIMGTGIGALGSSISMRKYLKV
ncbi:MAG: permease-like cell division protein FtsX [Clostridia bacterium]